MKSGFIKPLENVAQHLFTPADKEKFRENVSGEERDDVSKDLNSFSCLRTFPMEKMVEQSSMTTGFVFCSVIDAGFDAFSLFSLDSRFSHQSSGQIFEEARKIEDKRSNRKTKSQRNKTKIFEEEFSSEEVKRLARRPMECLAFGQT